jgi:hypothetical protein
MAWLLGFHKICPIIVHDCINDRPSDLIPDLVTSIQNRKKFCPRKKNFFRINLPRNDGGMNGGITRKTA